MRQVKRQLLSFGLLTQTWVSKRVCIWRVPTCLSPWWMPLSRSVCSPSVCLIVNDRRFSKLNDALMIILGSLRFRMSKYFGSARWSSSRFRGMGSYRRWIQSRYRSDPTHSKFIRRLLRYRSRFNFHVCWLSAFTNESDDSGCWFPRRSSTNISVTRRRNEILERKNWRGSESNIHANVLRCWWSVMLLYLSPKLSS